MNTADNLLAEAAATDAAIDALAARQRQLDADTSRVQAELDAANDALQSASPEDGAAFAERLRQFDEARAACDEVLSRQMAVNDEAARCRERADRLSAEMAEYIALLSANDRN